MSVRLPYYCCMADLAVKANASNPNQGRMLEALLSSVFVCRLNLSVGVQYTAAWLNGTGSVPLHNLMEDAATAEISRVQVWQVSGRKNEKLRIA